ncbi:MAG: hypothetical protein KDA84_00525, partial [Planctomycetaceae bacterium]|nr:hypothetical protein [Planctomycetaceae bacterium]
MPAVQRLDVSRRSNRSSVSPEVMMPRPIRTSPDAQQRLDDLKQYWYFYYLIDTGAMEAKSPEMVEFFWKGQMSYMT